VPGFSVDWDPALDALGSLHACFRACVPLSVVLYRGDGAGQGGSKCNV
jgi:hypothetical protein